LPTKARQSRAFLLALWLPAFALAAPVAEKKAELKDLQGRIDALRQDLAKSEETRAYAVDQLRETESTISAANRRLRELGGTRSEVQTELADLDQQTRRLMQQTATQQQQLARLLFRHYARGIGGDGDALQLLIAGRDPNQAARDYHFLTLLSKAKAELIGGLRTAAAEKKQLAALAREKSERLAAIEQQQQQERAALLTQRQQRQALLAKVADRIKAQRHEIDSLRRDELRLTKLIDGLAKLAAARPHAKAKPRAAPTLRVERIPDGAASGGAFAALKGKLRLPVKGTVAGRFGTKRDAGGLTWKGLFIRAAEGAEVHAVAAGSVVFSDWLRGFGNLMIVDHGGGFLSVYGNNESLLLQAGENVKAGAVIATVGNSGGNPESGLYFELRHQGQAFDPMKWANLR